MLRNGYLIIKQTNYASNNKERNLTMKTNVLDYLEDSVKNNPEKAAFVDECKTYTYMDLKIMGRL